MCILSHWVECLSEAGQHCNAALVHQPAINNQHTMVKTQHGMLACQQEHMIPLSVGCQDGLQHIASNPPPPPLGDSYPIWSSVYVAHGIEGVCVCVWLDAGAHEAQERTQAPLQTNLISYSSHAQAPKEWFYYPHAAQPPSSPTEGDVHVTCMPIVLSTPVKLFPFLLTLPLFPRPTRSALVLPSSV